VRVLQGEVTDFDLETKDVLVDSERISFDFLVVATGATHHYFGHEEWAELAPGLKTVEDATRMRARILKAFELAERESDERKRAALLTFVIVGGGPTGVELAGAIGELARQTLAGDFRAIDPATSRILLVEGADRLLSSYPEVLSCRAAAALGELGVTVRTNAMVTAIEPGSVTLKRKDATERVEAATILWAAGVQASPLGAKLAKKASASCDRAGRVRVEPDLSLPGRPDVFVIGDLAALAQDGEPLPGIAPVAMQQGHYVAKRIRDRMEGKDTPPFRYRDRGNLAVIGRARAVALLGRFCFWGYPAWLLWLFVHLLNLVAFENRVIVFLQWAWSYVTRNRRARLITMDKVDL
jgi:NADH dehydrogenase